MRRRSHSRRKHYGGRGRHRVTNDDIGCLTSVLTLPFLLAGALILGGDPDEKRGGWYLLVFLVLAGSLFSAGASGGIVLILFIIMLGMYLYSLNEKNTSSSSERTESFNISASPEKIPSMKKDVNIQKGETSKMILEEGENAMVKSLGKSKRQLSQDQEHSENMIFDQDLVLLQTNGCIVNEKISPKKNVAASEVYSNLEKDYATYPMFQKEDFVHVSYYTTVNEAVQKNHVPENYCKIMIEEIKHTNVKECPAIAWKDQDRFYILPLYVGTPIYSWPLDAVGAIEYKMVTNIDFESTYQNLIGELIASEYEELMPKYFMGEKASDTERYVLSNGVEVTHASGEALKQLLDS